MALLSISNDKLPGTLVLNCAISDLACFAWLQSDSNPSPGPHRSAVDNTYSRSICQTNSSEPPLPLCSPSILTSLKCQPEYLLSHWVNSGDLGSAAPDLQSFFSIRADDYSLFVFLFTDAQNYVDYRLNSAKSYTTPPIHPFQKEKEIYFPAVINYKHLQYPPRTAVINLHNLVRFTAANIWIRLLILGCKTTNQPPLDHHVGSKMKTGLYNIIITVLYK